MSGAPVPRREPASDILEHCTRLGFALAGVCQAAPSARGQFFRNWLADGRHGEMAWLARNVETRLDPRALVADARSIICVADMYQSRGANAPARAGTGANDGAEHERAGGAPGKVARYARGDDYHEAMKSRLHQLCDALRARHPGHEFRACVDTAPLMEREHAARAGLGWIGKHTLLINPRLGSWLFLGAVVTTLQIEPSCDEASPPVADHCGSCTRCIDACPTRAITPYSVDASRCVSYLTIEHRTPIADAPLRAGIGDWLFGCDVCQEVCPHNAARAPSAGDPGGASGGASGGANEAYAPRFETLDARQVAAWTEEDRRRVLSGSAMKRASLEMLRRNAVIVAENRQRTPIDAKRSE